MREAELITTSQAAKILDCVPDNVRKLARTGTLPIAGIVGVSQRLFNRQQVEQFAAERRQRQLVSRRRKSVA